MLIIGFGAKLGLLPFYEWFPSAYGAGSGASGALMSGVVLNAAFYGLSRGLSPGRPVATMPSPPASASSSSSSRSFSAILTALYAFQQEDWRRLLSFSSAENASLAVAMLGVALIFRGHGKPELASLAWTVALLHLAGHALAKGGLFLTADGVYRATGRYDVLQTDLLRRSSWVFGLGALFAAMSLAAMPPQAGFVSEWYMFETVFQGFRLDTLVSRLGPGARRRRLGAHRRGRLRHLCQGVRRRPARTLGAELSAGAGGAAALPSACWALAHWRSRSACRFGSTDCAWRSPTSSPRKPRARCMTGCCWCRSPSSFAFISPTKLVIVMPLLALVPILMVLARRRFAVRRVPVWYGGLAQDPERASTTALTFSNALRTFYSFVYRPTEETRREAKGVHYFVHRLVFSHDVAPIFGPYLFAPVTRAVYGLAEKLKALQSGHLNFYLALIGALLVIILALTL